MPKTTKKKGLRLSQDALKTWDDIQQDKSTTNWAIFELKEGSKKVVTTLMSGVGGAPQIEPYLDPTKLMWIGFRVTGVDEITKEDGTKSQSLRPKFVVICWLGEKMPPIQRAKFRESGSKILKQFRNTVVQYYALEASAVSLPAIEEKLSKLAKCTRFDWENKEQMLAVGLPPDVPPPVDPFLALKKAAEARKAKTEAKQAQRAMERKKKEEAAAKAEAELRAAEAAAEEEKRIKEEAQAKIEAEKAAEKAKLEAAEAKKKFEEEVAKKKAEEDARAKAKAAAEAKLKAEEEARKRAEEEKKAREEARAAKIAQEKALAEAKAQEKAAAEAARAKAEAERDGDEQAHKEATRAQKKAEDEKAKAEALANAHEETKEIAEARARVADQEKARNEQAACAHAVVEAKANALATQARHENEKTVEARSGVKGLDAPITTHLEEKVQAKKEKHRTAAVEAYQAAQEELEHARHALMCFSATNESRPLSGVFQIEVQSATNLMNKDKHLFGRKKQDVSDPFFQILFWNGSKESMAANATPESRTSETLKDNLDPSWDMKGCYMFETKNLWTAEFQIVFFDDDGKSSDFLGQTGIMKLRAMLRDCGNQGRGTDPYKSYHSELDTRKLHGKGVRHGACHFKWSWMPQHEVEYCVAKENFDIAQEAVTNTAHTLRKEGNDPKDWELSVTRKEEIASMAADEASEANAALLEEEALSWQEKEKRKILQEMHAQAAANGRLGEETDGMVEVTLSNDSVWGVNFGHREWKTLTVTGICKDKQGDKAGIKPSWRVKKFGDHDVKDFAELVEIKNLQKQAYQLTFSLPTGLPFQKSMWPGCDISVGGLHAEDVVLTCTENRKKGEPLVQVRSDRKFRYDYTCHCFSVTFDKLMGSFMEFGLVTEQSHLDTPLGMDGYSWSFHSGGFFLHNGRRCDVPGMQPLNDGDTVTLILDYTRNQIIFDMWSCNRKITTVEPWPKLRGEQLNFHNLVFSPAFAMCTEGQKLIVCEPHNPKNPKHPQRGGE